VAALRSGLTWLSNLSFLVWLVVKYFCNFIGKFSKKIINQSLTKNTKTMKKIFFLMSMFVSIALLGQTLDMSKLSGMKPRSIGPAGMSGRVTAIDVNLQNQNIMFVGSASGGLWRSTDKGISWKPVFDKQKTLSIGCIAVDQKNPDIIWVGTGEGNPRNSLSSGKGIYRSLDGVAVNGIGKYPQYLPDYRKS
jgi:hypothetical protein